MLRPVEDVRSVKLRTLPRIRSRIIKKLTHRGRETGRRASLGEPRASLRLKAFFCVGCCGIQQRRAVFSVSFDVILEGTPPHRKNCARHPVVLLAICHRIHTERRRPKRARTPLGYSHAIDPFRKNP
jgi:hypothetical protein